MKKKQKQLILPYLLIVPTLISCGVFKFYPFLKTIISSFSVTDEFGAWIGWAGTVFWKMMFTDAAFWQTLTTTLKYALLTFVGTFVIAMIFAMLSTKKTKFGKVSQMLYALPIAVAHSTSSVIFLFVFKGEGGLLNSWLGTDVAWLTKADTAFWAVVVVTIWTHISGSFLYLLAGFRGVSEDILEAATVDGANSFVRAVKIMIPMASPQIFYVLFLNIISAMGVFTQVKLLTGGGPSGATTSLMYEIYLRAVKFGEYEYACCVSIVTFLIIFIFTRIQFAFEKKMVYYQ